MSIKKTGQNVQIPTQINIQPLTEEVKSQATQSKPSSESAKQNVFETFSTNVSAQQAAPITSALDSGGKVMSVLQQTISQLKGVDSVDSIGHMTGAEMRTLETQGKSFQGHMQGLVADSPEAFSESLQQIFGSKLGGTALQDLVSQTQNGKFPMPAQIKFVDGEVLRGADAAYSQKDGGTVLINRSLKDRPARLQIALTEEIGHHLDKVIGGADSIGDEGELFQRAMAKGGPLTGKELRAGKFDSDHGKITLDSGETLDVEFRSDKTARFYEAQGSFSEVDTKLAGQISFVGKLEQRLIDKFDTVGSPISSMEELKTHLEGQGIDLDFERLTTKNEMLQEYAGTTQDLDAIGTKLLARFEGKTLNDQPLASLDDVKAYCVENGKFFEEEMALAEQDLLKDVHTNYTKSEGSDICNEAQAATLIAKLKKGKVLGETANLDTQLPFNVLQRVESDPVLSAQEPPIETYGELFKALTSDVDNDGKSDFDSLQLGRFLPQSSQQDILKAIDHSISNDDLKEQLRGAGFENSMLDSMVSKGMLSIDPPKAFGLEGRTDLERTQQQLLLRTGQVFMDSNEDGKIDDTDTVQYVDSAGSIRETSYAELDSGLKKLVKYNIATTKACEDYAALSSWDRINFPSYDSRTGESKPEAVNEDFWAVGKAEANSNQASWELKEDIKPSDALDDVFGGNGGKYTTECAQGRTMLRLKGLNNYYKSEFGEGAGTFRFNALFGKGSIDKARASDYVKEFDAFQKDNPEKGWDEFTQANPVPEMNYALEVSRHVVLGDNEAVIQPWKRTSSESASGDTGYFHNYSVSVEGVKIGYVGENVIDLGFQGGKRRYWGHPGGIQSEEKWSEELGTRRIAVHNMSEYGDYFSSKDITRGSARVTKERVEDLQESMTELQANHPAGWEDQIKEKDAQMGWWQVLDVARQSVATSIDPAKAKEAEAFFQNANSVFTPESFDDLLATMKPEGVEKLAESFSLLGKSSTESILNHFGKSDISELSTEEKATSALLLTYGSNGQIHSVLREEGERSVKNIHFEDASSWLKSGGNMASKEAFQGWLKTDDFQAWYKENAQSDYSGETDLSKMTIANVQDLVEMVFPMTKGMRTIYAEVNSGQQELSEQMATLLKDGKLPEAAYALDSNPVAPLD